jgi:hypothetical protein
MNGRIRVNVVPQAREAREDVDLEGEVEFADPKRVVSYIRDSTKLILNAKEVGAAISSIQEPVLRGAFEKAHRPFLVSRRINRC